MSNPITKDAFWAVRKQAPKQKMIIPGIGEVWIRGFMPIDKMRWLELSEVGGEMNAALSQAVMVRLCVCQEDGTDIFNNNDVPCIKELPCVIVEAICDVCCKLSGIGSGSSEDILKNYGATLNADSLSGDPINGESQ